MQLRGGRAVRVCPNPNPNPNPNSNPNPVPKPNPNPNPNPNPKQVRVCPLLSIHHASFDTEPDIPSLRLPKVGSWG